MKNTLGASFVNDFTGGKIPIVPTPTPGEDVPIPSDGEVVIFDPTDPKDGDTPSQVEGKEKIIERPIYTIIPKSSTLLQLPERIYGVIKRVGILDKEPILYGDANLLKQGQLYYLSSVKQVYRFIKADTEYVYFATIKSIRKDNDLLIPEEEKGTIRNAGYLFNEIIYSGDPNLVENGQLYYHDTFPYISVVSVDNNIINLSTKIIKTGGDVETVFVEYRVSPKPTNDKYKSQFFTMKLYTQENVDTAEITVERDCEYSLNGGVTWNELHADETLEVENYNNKTVLLKDFSITAGVYDYGTIHCNVGYDAYGNIMSIVDGDNFTELNGLQDGYTFINLFAESPILSAKYLVLPTLLTEGCFTNMFTNSTLTEAPELPALILADSCYSNMFEHCNITESPVLPALNAVDGCYGGMFKDCSNLRKITAYFITDPHQMMFAEDWVKDVYVPQDDEEAVFIRNAAATWAVSPPYVPQYWTVKEVKVPQNKE